MYTKTDLGNDLERELANEFNIIKLSQWAYSKYLEKSDKMSNEVEEIIMKIVTMEEGPEFEYTLNELKQLAKDLKKSNNS